MMYNKTPDINNITMYNKTPDINYDLGINLKLIYPLEFVIPDGLILSADLTQGGPIGPGIRGFMIALKFTGSYTIVYGSTLKRTFKMKNGKQIDD